MLLDLIEKLVDRCISLVKEHKETKRQFLEDFVVPIYSEFQSVHDGYLQSFREYRALLDEDGDLATKSAKLRDKLHEDNLFTSGQRAKLLQFDNLRSDDVYGDFINAIANYLLGSFLHLLGTDGTVEVFPVVQQYQVWRNSLAQQLDDAKDEAEAIAMLDEIVATMQLGYTDVTNKYVNLKRTLTK